MSARCFLFFPKQVLLGVLKAFQECPPCCGTTCPPSVRLVSHCVRLVSLLFWSCLPLLVIVSALSLFRLLLFPLGTYVLSVLGKMSPFLLVTMSVLSLVLSPFLLVTDLSPVLSPFLLVSVSVLSPFCSLLSLPSVSFCFPSCLPSCLSSCPSCLLSVSLCLRSCLPSGWSLCPFCLPSVSFCLPSCLQSCWPLRPFCLPSVSFCFLSLMSQKVDLGMLRCCPTCLGSTVV